MLFFATTRVLCAFWQTKQFFHNNKMRAVILVCVLLIALVVAGKYDNVEKLQVGIKFRPEKCDKKIVNGDNIKVHYTYVNNKIL